MNFLGLGSGSDFPGSDGPNGFVGNDNFVGGPGGWVDGGRDGRELAGYDAKGFVGISLLVWGE